jgi:hypothetical protein
MKTAHLVALTVLQLHEVLNEELLYVRNSYFLSRNYSPLHFVICLCIYFYVHSEFTNLYLLKLKTYLWRMTFGKVFEFVKMKFQSKISFTEVRVHILEI